jgi:hypothetical protein
MNIATTPGVRYIPSATKVPTAENYLSIDALITLQSIARFGQNS